MDTRNMLTYGNTFYKDINRSRSTLIFPVPNPRQVQLLHDVKWQINKCTEETINKHVEEGERAREEERVQMVKVVFPTFAVFKTARFKAAHAGMKGRPEK